MRSRFGIADTTITLIDVSQGRRHLDPRRRRGDTHKHDETTL